MNKKLLKKYLLLSSMLLTIDNENVTANNNLKTVDEGTAGISSILNDTLSQSDAKTIYEGTAGVSSILMDTISVIDAKLTTSVALTDEDYVTSNNIENTIYLEYNEEPENHFNYINSNYSHIFDEVCEMYGLDPLLYMAIASQEYGVESNNIVQISKSYWLNKTISAYNFQTGDYESMLIDDECFIDPYKNIKAGAMILQYSMYQLDGNILAGIQGYNYGDIVVKKCLEKYGNDNGLSLDEILDNQSDINWIDYVSNYMDGNYGDSSYIYNVLRHIHNDDYVLSLKMIDGSTESIYVEKKTK